jgi:TfoX/Sxy family transcriptional regulator of competence genes
MAYDERLAHRVERYFEGRSDVEVKKMFGGLCFMVANHMCCGIVGDRLMARVGPERYEACLEHPQASEMDFSGRPLTGMVYVAPEGIASDAELASWVQRCEEFVRTLPPKTST